jgi:hypothetical protein
VFSAPVVSVSMSVVLLVAAYLSFREPPAPVRVFSAPVASVSMSLVLRCAKKLRVITALVGSWPAADFWTDIVDFLTVCEVSLEICLPLASLYFWKSSSWDVDSSEVLFTAPLCPAFSSFNVSVYMP